MSREATQFKPGQVANPRGRPLSNRKRLDDLLAGREDHILRKAILMAIEGDKDMIKFIGERYMPIIPKDDPADVDLIDKNYEEQGQEVMRAITEGRITAHQGHTIMAAISTNVQIVQATDMIKRIEALERDKK